jgi:hypothetical protein
MENIEEGNATKYLENATAKMENLKENNVIEEKRKSTNEMETPEKETKSLNEESEFQNIVPRIPTKDFPSSNPLHQLYSPIDIPQCALYQTSFHILCLCQTSFSSYYQTFPFSIIFCMLFWLVFQFHNVQPNGENLYSHNESLVNQTVPNWIP